MWTARDLLKSGAIVIFACRNESKTLNVIKSITDKNTIKNAFFINLDLTSYSSVENFDKEFSKKFNKIDILINNAGEFFENLENYIEELDGYIERMEEQQSDLEGEIEDADEYSQRYDEIQKMIDDATENRDSSQEELDNIEPDTEPTQDMVDNLVSERVSDALSDPIDFMRNFGLEVKDFVNKDDLAQALVDADGWGIMNSYDGNYDSMSVNNETYYVMRVE